MTTDQDEDVLARTVWGEARGESVRGMEAVACVVMNRVAVARAHGGAFWWGGTVVEVCKKKWQFSCWNEDDPNREKVMAVNERDAEFRIAKRIARRAVKGALEDPTGGATHYHVEGVMPKWVTDPRMEEMKKIGRHVFYREHEMKF